MKSHGPFAPRFGGEPSARGARPGMTADGSRARENPGQMADTASGRKLRVGVLGCGPIAQAAHFESCRKARNAELYAICDVADDLRERMAATHRPQRSYGD